MSNKVTMEVKANTFPKGSEIALEARGSFGVYFSPRSEISQMLDVKDKEKFKVTIERIKK